MQNAPRVLILNHDNWARPYCTGKEDDEVPEGHTFNTLHCNCERITLSQNLLKVVAINLSLM